MNITNSDMNLISFVIYFLLFEFLLQKKDGLRFVTPKKFVKSIIDMVRFSIRSSLVHNKDMFDSNFGHDRCLHTPNC